jgi:hypothetical protein
MQPQLSLSYYYSKQKQYKSFFHATTLQKLHKSDQNPFEARLQMYESGLKPVGFRNFKGTYLYVVDFPVVNNRHILGCYVYGDRELTFYHE